MATRRTRARGMLVGLVLLGCVGPTGVHELESLEHAHRLLPSNAQIRLLLSEAYAAVGRYGPARDLAASVLGWSHDAESRERASELIGRIDELSMSAATGPQPTR